jgi:hypothetical protein
MASPPFDQISLNLFKTDLNKSEILLFIWARPTFSFRPAHALTRDPGAHMQPTCAARFPAPARCQTPPDRRPSPPLPCNCRDVGPHAPPASAWRHPQRTPPCLVLHSFKPCTDVVFFFAIATVTSSHRPASTPHQPPRQ